ELGVGAGLRRAVLPAADDVRAVAEPVTLEVVVAHLDDQLWADRFPRLALSGVPPALGPGHAAARLGHGAGPLPPGMVLEGVLPVRRQRLDQGLALGHREGGRDPDVVERAGVVVEAEQQRADHPAA